MNLVLVLIYLFFSGVCSSFMSPAEIKVKQNQILSLINATIGNTQCGFDLNLVISDAFDSKIWALLMMDASAKIYSGLLEGNIHQVGNFDECLSVNEQINDSVIRGKYCTVAVSLKDEYLQYFDIPEMNKKKKQFELMDLHIDVASLYYDICIPKSCTKQELDTLWKYFETTYNLPVYLTFVNHMCRYSISEVPENDLDVFAFVFFAATLLIIGASTAYDFYLRLYGKNSNIYVIFSIYQNTLDLFNTKRTANNLSCLYGIKVLCTVWVILGHFIFFMHFISNNLQYMFFEWRFETRNVFYIAPFFAVDSFFTISGFLVTYIYFKYSEKCRISLTSFYLVRFLRLMPAFFAMILFRISVLKYILSGSQGATAFHAINYHCRYWWDLLLFINNFFKCDHQCLFPSWYLAVDTQFYIMAPLFLFVKKRHLKKVVTALIVACMSVMLYNFGLVVYNRMGFVIYEFDEFFFKNVYIKPFYHMPSWLIGILFGYFLYYYESVKTFVISRTMNRGLWIITVCTMLQLIFYHHTFLVTEYNVYRSAFMNALGRPLWSLATCFIIFSCSTERGEPANTFLSNSCFYVLNKLTYCLFLTHDSVLLLMWSQNEVKIRVNNFKIFYYFSGTLVLVFAFSFVLYVAFEAPIAALKKYVDKRKVEPVRV